MSKSPLSNPVYSSRMAEKLKIYERDSEKIAVVKGRKLYSKLQFINKNIVVKAVFWINNRSNGPLSI